VLTQSNLSNISISLKIECIFNLTRYFNRVRVNTRFVKHRCYKV